MEMWLSIVGFLVVVAIIVTIMTKKLSTMVALSVIPLVGAILVGGAADIPAYLTAGINKVAANGVMFVFAILFFGSMMTAGALLNAVKEILYTFVLVLMFYLLSVIWMVLQLRQCCSCAVQ